MADEKKPTEESQPEPPKKSKKLLLILIGVIGLGIGGGAGFFLMGGDDGAAATTESSEAAAVDEPAGLVAMDTFLVNLNDNDGDRYMKLTLRLTVVPLSDAERIDEDELIQARMRDRILTVLSSKSFAELSNPLGKESLRREIQDQLDPLLEPARTQDVLFSEFVVQ